MKDVAQDYQQADYCDLQELRIIPALDPTSQEALVICPPRFRNKEVKSVEKIPLVQSTMRQELLSCYNDR